jgi:hypothetical protein
MENHPTRFLIRLWKEGEAGLAGLSTKVPLS